MNNKNTLAEILNMKEPDEKISWIHHNPPSPPKSDPVFNPSQRFQSEDYKTKTIPIQKDILKRLERRAKAKNVKTQEYIRDYINESLKMRLDSVL